MAEVFHIQRRVEFHETDIAGIVHFVSFFKYMEEAEHAFLRSLGLSVMTQTDDGKISFPRVSTSCDFINPVTFEDLLDVEVRVAGLGAKSVRYRHEFRHKGHQVARGEMTSVCCRFVDGEKPHSIMIPESFRALIEPYVDSGAAKTDKGKADGP